MGGDPRVLMTMLTVFVGGSTQWKARSVPTPGRVVLRADCGTTDVSVHLDREGIAVLQAALGEALALAEKDAVSAA
jgi:hypothetical protein